MNQVKNKSIHSSHLTLEDALSKEITKEEALLSIQSDDVTKEKYQKFPETVQEDILGFIRGQHGLKITYDSFFQTILSPSMQQTLSCASTTN